MVKGIKGLSDPRFVHLKSDPKFGGLKRKDRKVVLEDRFAGLLTDDKFTRAPIVDKRGRKVKRTGDATLHRLYEVDETKNEKEKEPVKEGEGREEEGSEDNVDGSDENEDDPDRHAKYDLARGDAEYVSSSSDDEEEEDEEWELERAQVDHDWGNLDKEARRVEWASRRLAICNLDWDSLSSEDLFLLVSSFKPLGGHIESLSIYLSDMGKEKLEREEKEGPQLIINENREKEEKDDENDEILDEETLKHNDRKREAIRKYQMERLKYFYAVLVCDSEQTASAVYENCDGVEYENSGLRLDLRFVPDLMSFDEDRLKERVTAEDVDSCKYKPREISNLAAASTKVKLTWEESDVNRKKKMRGAFDEGADLDRVSRDLIAPSSGEEENGEEEMTERVLSKKERLSILLGGEDREDEDIEVEWEKDEDNQTEGIQTKKKCMSTWEKYLEKRKVKRKEKKRMVKEEKRKAKEDREKDDEEKRTERKKVLKEEKKQKEDRDINVDLRFNALFTNSAFSIDAASNLNKSKGLVEKQSAGRRKRKADAERTSPTHGEHNSLITKLKIKSSKWSS